VATVSLVAGFDFPDFDREYEFVALHLPDEYAITDGRIVSSSGLDIDPTEWPDHFEETHVEWSNALHANIKGGGGYYVGPMARFALNGEQLSPSALTAASSVGLVPGFTNPFKSIVVRAVEIVHACETALEIIKAYEPPDPPFLTVEPRSATGHGASEARPSRSSKHTSRPIRRSSPWNRVLPRVTERAKLPADCSTTGTRSMRTR
jgi:coenzyme F420-reducing hydrogenase alpha subunit